MELRRSKQNSVIMMENICRHIVIVFLLLINFGLHAQPTANSGNENKPGIIPVGLDAYRMWDKWPMQRLGTRTYMRSTYDRDGGNESADASHFLFSNAEDHNVTLDVKGKGVLSFFRSNHWHGSPWHFVVDGKDNIVKETGTSDPVNAKKIFTDPAFIPYNTFPKPLNWTWATTKGGDLIWSPIAFTDSFQIAYSRTRYGTGYYIYQLYANEDDLSSPIETWNINKVPGNDVLELINRSGTDIAPLNINQKKGKIKLDKKQLNIATIKSSPSVIRAFKLKIPLEKALELETIRLVVTWDDRKQPSIDAPLSLFFGAGTFYNRDEKEFLVKGFPINIRYDYTNKKIELACYYPMPFFKSARFEIKGINETNAELEYEIRYERLNTPMNQNGYFHATYKDHGDPEPGKDLLLLDTRSIEDGQEWAGNFAGTSFIFSDSGRLGTLEGDPRFFFDDSQTPQAYGTGTEEWGGGGDYWGGQNMTLPFAGHPCGIARREQAKNDKDLIESAYRFLLADLMPFGRRAVIRLEHGGENLSSEHYKTVVYWYGLPAAALIKTDDIDIGDTTSEKRHNYNSPQSSDVQTILSRYEWGIDLFPTQPWGLDPAKLDLYKEKAGKEIYGAQKEDGRITTGTSQFQIALDPGNYGALLRRTLDYSYPNQTAEVYIADTLENAEWKRVGIWYLAGSNTCIYSDPKGELDKSLNRTNTSNRKLRADEFLIPAHLTQNKSSVKIKIKFIPNNQLLFQDFPFPKQSAWSELRYEVYSYMTPAFYLEKIKK